MCLLFAFRTTHYCCCITQAQEVFNDFSFALIFLSSSAFHSNTYKPIWMKKKKLGNVFYHHQHVYNNNTHTPAKVVGSNTNAFSLLFVILSITIYFKWDGLRQYTKLMLLLILILLQWASFLFSLFTEKMIKLQYRSFSLFIIFCSFIVSFSLYLFFCWVFLLLPYYIDFQGK